MNQNLHAEIAAFRAEISELEIKEKNLISLYREKENPNDRKELDIIWEKQAKMEKELSILLRKKERAEEAAWFQANTLDTPEKVAKYFATNHPNIKLEKEELTPVMWGNPLGWKLCFDRANKAFKLIYLMVGEQAAHAHVAWLKNQYGHRLMAEEVEKAIKKFA